MLECTESEESILQDQRRKRDRRVKDVDESWIGRRLRKLDGVDFDDPAVRGYKGGYRKSEAPIELEESDNDIDENEVFYEGRNEVRRNYMEVDVDHFAKRA